MNAIVRESKQLSVPEQVDRALDFENTKAKLLTLAGGSKDIVAITNRAGYEQVHALRMVLKNTRINVERSGELARKDAVEFQRTVIARANELVALIQPEEKRLEALQKAEDDREAAEKAAKAKIEADRIAAIEEVIACLAAAPGESIHADADKLRSRIKTVQAVDLSEMDEVYRPRALDTQKRAVADLQRMLEARIQADENAAALAAERAENERLKAEQRERDRIAAEEQAARDAISAALARKAQARIDELEAAARAEAERQEAEREAARTAQEAAERAEAERQAQVAAETERERVAAAAKEAERLEAERTEATRIENERNRKAYREMVERATPLEAMQAAYTFLTTHGHEDVLCTRMLADVIDREMQKHERPVAEVHMPKRKWKGKA